MAQKSTVIAQAKVTLTNWQRLNNSPMLLPRASAVQWKGNLVFVLASDKTALLYMKEEGIWSSLPKCNIELISSKAPPLAVHEGKVLTVGQNGDVAHYDFTACKWKVLEDYKLPKRETTSEKFTRIVIFSHNPLLLLTEVKDDRSARHSASIMWYHPESKWGDENVVSRAPIVSTALVGEYLYLLLSDGMYKLTLPKKEQIQSSEASPNEDTTVPKSDQPKSKQAKPLYSGCTLHNVKGTLFAFGGRDEDNQPTSDVLRYNPDTDDWESAGYMRSARYHVAVTTVQRDNELSVMVMGGRFGCRELQMKSKLTYSASSSSPQDWVDSHLRC